jgi:hypothetical protein
MRPRRFYNTRYTFISVALTLGCNQKWLAEQCGTSIAMLQQSYGKYIRDDGDALLRAYITRSVASSSPKEQETGANEEETETFSDESVNYPGMLVVPTGIEPVLPT